MTFTSYTVSFVKSALDAGVPDSVLNVDPYIEYGTSSTNTVPYSGNSLSKVYPAIFGGRLGATGYVSSNMAWRICSARNMIGFTQTASNPTQLIGYMYSEGYKALGGASQNDIEASGSGFFKVCFQTTNEIQTIGVFRPNSNILVPVTTVVLPPSVTVIQQGAFDAFQNLSNVFFSLDTQGSALSMQLFQTSFPNMATCRFVVPDASLIAYRTLLTQVGANATNIVSVSKFCTT